MHPSALLQNVLNNQVNMFDLVRYIRNLVSTASDDSRKRRVPADEYDIPISTKVRRISPSPMSNSLEDDWYSTSSAGSVKRRSGLHNSTIGTKHKPSWSKENVVLTVDDDDDDILEISKPKQTWMDSLRKPGKPSHFTSTPNLAVAPRASINRNGDEDVTLLKYTSLEDKKMNAKRQSLEYINPHSFLTDNQNKGRAVQNGPRPRIFISPFSSVPEIKAKLKLNPRPSIRSSTLEQSFRLDEKNKYKQLLQQEAPTSSSLRDSFSKYSTPVGKIYAGNTSGRGRKLVDMAISKNKRNSFIDLTSNGISKKPTTKLSTKETIRKVLDQFDNEPVVVKDSDSDVEMFPTPPSPKPDIKVERVNSIKKVVDTAEQTSSEWLSKIIQKHQDEIAKYQRNIQSQIAQKQKLSQVTSEVYAQRLENQMLKCLHIKDTVLPIHIAEPGFPELTEEDEMRIDNAISKRGSPDEVMVKKFNLNITRRDIQTLAGLNWLNDEVINFYMNLLIERGKDSKWPKTYAFNTFFYPKLLKDGPASLRRWTRRVDLFAHDIIAIPIHLGVHWCMSIIDFRNRSIRYFDSMGSTNRKCLEALRSYLKAEHLDKKKKEYNMNDWILENVEDIPQQMNGSDCGMFSCTFAEFLTRDAKITFCQEDMPYLRRKMVLEILNGELMIQ